MSTIDQHSGYTCPLRTDAEITHVAVHMAEVTALLAAGPHRPQSSHLHELAQHGVQVIDGTTNPARFAAERDLFARQLPA